MCCKRYSPSTIQFSGDLLLCLRSCAILFETLFSTSNGYYTLAMLYVIFSLRSMHGSVYIDDSIPS